MKTRMLVMLLCVCVVTGSASAAYVDFNGTVDDQWSNPANWSGGVLPTSAEGVGINYGISAEIAGIDAVAGPMYIYGGAHVTVSSGSFTVASGSALDIYLGTLTVTGGNVTVGSALADALQLGAHNTSGVINVSGGKISIQTFYLSHGTASSVGVVNLSGGEMEVVRIFADENGSDGTIDITGSGVFRIKGDVYDPDTVGKLQNMIDLGDIITSDPLGVLLITEISDTEATVTMIPEPATMALLALGGLFTLRRKK